MTDTTKRDEVLARFEDPRFDPVAARYGGHRIQRQRMADRIVELEELALAERATVMRQAEELTRLRAAVERVRALHVSSVRRGFGECDECRCDHPCPTLRALDGEP